MSFMDDINSSFVFTDEEDIYLQTEEDSDDIKNDPPEKESENNQDDEFEDDEKLTLTDLSKVYQMKKIYTTLNELYDMAFTLLSYDQTIKQYIILVKKTLDYYKLIVDNLDQYKDKLDLIIIILNRFCSQGLKYLNKKVDRIKKPRNQEKDGAQNEPTSIFKSNE